MQARTARLFAVSLAAGFAITPGLKANAQVGKLITTDSGVKVYTLPADLQTVVEGDDGKYYAINYYTYWTPENGSAIPGISQPTWWDNNNIKEFFPWGADADLAKQLSAQYQVFASSDLDADGNLTLNGYTNGGGFIYGNWDGKENEPIGATQRPTGSTQNSGLTYYWNNTKYFTKGGTNGRIQAFGGCAVNTIGSGETPETDDLVTSATDPCEFVNGVVRQDTYAPVFQGGTLKTKVGTTNITPPFWIGREGGTIDNNGINTTFSGVFSDIYSPRSTIGSLTFRGTATTTLSADNTYTGNTNIEQGTLRVTGTLSDKTRVNVSAGATYSVGKTDTIGSIAGEGDVQIDNGVTLTAGGDGSSTEVSGDISGGGGFTKDGLGVTTFSGNNTYTGDTTIQAGTLKLGSATGIAQRSSTSVAEGATLDLNSQSPNIGSITLNGGDGEGKLVEMMAATAQLKGGAMTGTITSRGGRISGVTGANLNVLSGRTFLRDGVNLSTGSLTGGQLWAADDDTAAFNNFTLNSPTTTPDAPPQGTGLGSVQSNPGLVLGIGQKGQFSMRVGVNASRQDTGGSFTYQSGNIYIFVDPNLNSSDYEGTWRVLDFNRGDLTDEKYQEMFDNTYLLISSVDGSTYRYVKFNGEGNPVDGDEVTRTVKLIKGSLSIFVGDGSWEIDLCDLGIGDDCPETPDIVDPNSPGEISADGGVIADIADQFPVILTSDLRKIIVNTLIPRNTDAMGQSLATFNNRVADTIFERTPLRQFIELDKTSDQAQSKVEDTISKEISKLSSESNEKLNSGNNTQSRTNLSKSLLKSQETSPVDFNGREYLEDPSLTAEYAKRDGARAWIRAFSGTSSDYNGNADKIFNTYDISASGGVIGADFSLSPSVQIGAYANYGDINLWQNSELGNGAWSGNGWGGGVTADYWTDNFYIQGLLGASKFTGEHQRTIKPVRALVTASEPKADRDANTMVGALRIGAPFEAGFAYFEPQMTATWSRNDQLRFSESGASGIGNLTYKNRTTNYLQTATGLKLAFPISLRKKELLTPSLRVAWLRDWDLQNDPQNIGFRFTNRTIQMTSNQENQNGALIEGGLDYSIANPDGVSVKVYARGGAELWNGNRGSDWRTSGGLTFQF